MELFFVNLNNTKNYWYGVAPRENDHSLSITLVTERREWFNAANGRRPKGSGTTTWILWMQGVGLNECLLQKKNENLIANKN